MLPLSFVVTSLALTAPPDPRPAVDRHGDALPKGAVARLGSIRFRGPATWGLGYSGDGKRLLAPDAKVIRVWDAETGKPLPDIACPPSDGECQIEGMVMVGERVLRTGGTGIGPRAKQFLFVGSAEDGKEIRRVATDNHKPVISGNQMTPQAALSADGRKLAVMSHPDGVELWDVGKEKPVAELGKDSCGPVALSADGGVFCTVHHTPRVVRVWDTAGGKMRSELEVKQAVRLLRVSADGKRAVASVMKQPEMKDGKLVPPADPHALVVWDLDAGKEVGSIQLAAWPYDFKLVGSDAVVVGVGMTEAEPSARTLARWNLKTLKREWETPFSPPERFGRRAGWIAVAPDGTRTAVAGLSGPVAVFDTATGKRVNEPTGHSGPVRAVVFSADGTAVTSLGVGEQRTWDAATGELKSSAAPPEVLGQYAGMVVADGVGVWPAHAKGGTEVVGLDVTKGEVRWRFTSQFKHVARALSADGKRVLVFGGEQEYAPDTFAVYDGPTGKLAHEWTCPNTVHLLSPLALSADGGRLWAAGTKVDNATPRNPTPRTVLRGFRTTDGEERSEIDLPVGTSVNGAHGLLDRLVVPAADGSAVATAGYGVGVAVTSLGREPTTRKFEGAKVKPTAAVYSPDGKRLAAFGGHSTAVWVYKLDGPDDQPPQEFDGKGAGVTAAAFSPDGAKLGVGYADGTVLVWEVGKK